MVLPIRFYSIRSTMIRMDIELLLNALFFRYRHDLSLPIFLDTEIWKASCYIHQTTPPKQQRTNAQIADGWETFGIALKEE